MAFQRDHGTCCLVLPLKLGVGLSAMFVFVHSIFCIMALLSTDIRFQQTGYNLSFYYLPAITGSFGLVFGFVGMLGTYDDKWNQLWWFNRYFMVMLALMLVSIAADFVTLSTCDTYKNSSNSSSNPQLLALSEAGVCPWARWSYVVGCSVDFSFWAYCLYCCYSYEVQVRTMPPYAIDFGEKNDIYSRWDFYKVKNPKGDRVPPLGNQEEDPFDSYGAAEAAPTQYGPDGMPVRGAAQEGTAA